jgi:hypothetical protein
VSVGWAVLCLLYGLIAYRVTMGRWPISIPSLPQYPWLRDVLLTYSPYLAHEYEQELKRERYPYSPYLPPEYEEVLKEAFCRKHAGAKHRELDYRIKLHGKAIASRDIRWNIHDVKREAEKDTVFSKPYYDFIDEKYVKGRE